MDVSREVQDYNANLEPLWLIQYREKGNHVPEDLDALFDEFLRKPSCSMLKSETGARKLWNAYKRKGGMDAFDAFQIKLKGFLTLTEYAFVVGTSAIVRLPADAPKAKNVYVYVEDKEHSLDQFSKYYCKSSKQEVARVFRAVDETVAYS